MMSDTVQEPLFSYLCTCYLCGDVLQQTLIASHISELHKETDIILEKCYKIDDIRATVKLSSLMKELKLREAYLSLSSLLSYFIRRGKVVIMDMELPLENESIFNNQCKTELFTEEENLYMTDTDTQGENLYMAHISTKKENLDMTNASLIEENLYPIDTCTKDIFPPVIDKCQRNESLLNTGKSRIVHCKLKDFSKESMGKHRQADVHSKVADDVYYKVKKELQMSEDLDMQCDESVNDILIKDEFFDYDVTQELPSLPCNQNQQILNAPEKAAAEYVNEIYVGGFQKMLKEEEDLTLKPKDIALVVPVTNDSLSHGNPQKLQPIPCSSHQPILNTTKSTRKCKKSDAEDEIFQEDNQIHVMDDEEDSEVPSNYARPRRPCFYCKGQMKANVRRHQEVMHKNEKEVKAAMALPPKQRARAFVLLRRKGIEAFNMLQIGENKLEKLLKERRQGSNAENTGLKICGICKGFFGKKYFPAHFKNCNVLNINSPSVVPELSVKVKDLCLSSYADDEYFHTEILGKFIDDDIGIVCRTNETLKYVGYYLHICKDGVVKKQQGHKKLIMQDMRILARLYKNFQIIVNSENKKFEEMFNMESFNEFQEATRKTIDLKSSPKANLGFLIKRVIKCLNGKYSVERRKEEKFKLNEFRDALDNKIIWDPLFGKQQKYYVHKRHFVSREPSNHPMEDDLRILRNYIMTTMNNLVGIDYDIFDNNNYIALRRVTLCRLTILNARRGAEANKLSIDQYYDAIEDAWNNYDFVKDVINQKKMDIEFLKKFKIAFQTGNGDKTVSVLIPNDCLPALRILSDKNIRKAANVNPSNPFLFPVVGQQSLHHVTVGNDINFILTALGIEKNVTAKDLRHYISTKQDQIDLPNDVRQLFYIHMGHEEVDNKSWHQSPMVLESILKVGKILKVIHDNLDLGWMTSGNSISSGENKP